jgi:peptide/nickel transport system permease protein
VTGFVAGPAFGSPAATLRRALTNDSARRFWLNRPAVVATVVIVVLFLASFLGPFFTPDPTLVDVNSTFLHASWAHPLGTDDLGRDLLARVLDGGRVSFIVAFFATAVAVVPAGVLGIVAGYFGGILDDGLSRIFDILLAFPMLLLAIVVVAALGPSLTSVIIAIGISDVPRYGRLFRALTLELRDREFMRSAVALGYSKTRIILRHLLPNIYVPVLVIATGSMGKVALSESALSFLGVGVKPPQPSWGNIIAEGQPFLQYSPLIAVAPGVALTMLTIAFSFMGDGLRDAFDVREVTKRG